MTSSVTEVPGELGEISQADDAEQNEEVEAFSDVIARHLKQVVALELLEHAALQLHKLQE